MKRIIFHLKTCICAVKMRMSDKKIHFKTHVKNDRFRLLVRNKINKTENVIFQEDTFV